LYLALLWLWCRPAAAALILPLAQELTQAADMALKKKKKKKKKLFLILKDKMNFLRQELPCAWPALLIA